MRNFQALTLLKGEHKYAFFFEPANEESVRETLLILGRFAMNKELNFTWYDCAYLTMQVRVLVQRAKTGAGI